MSKAITKAQYGYLVMKSDKLKIKSSICRKIWGKIEPENLIKK